MGYCTLVSYSSTATHDRGHCNIMSTCRSHRNACRQTCPSEFTRVAHEHYMCGHTADCCSIKSHFILVPRYATTGCFNDGLVFFLFRSGSFLEDICCCVHTFTVLQGKLRCGLSEKECGLGRLKSREESQEVTKYLECMLRRGGCGT